MYLFRFVLILFSLVMVLTENAAAANCTTSQTVIQSTNISPDKIVLGQNPKLGPIGNVISIPSGSSATVKCSSGSVTSNWMTLLILNESMVKSSYASDVYETNVPGIGVKIWNEFKHSSNTGNLVVHNYLQKWYTHAISTSISAGSYLTGIKMQFYVIGPVVSGKIKLPEPFVSAWFNNSVSISNGAKYSVLNIPTQIDVVVPTCETSNLIVKMGKHDVTDFSGVGSTGREIPFDFEINNCPSLMKSVSYMLEAAPGVEIVGSDSEQYLTLNSSSNAKGIGIQVLQASNGQPVQFNQKIKINSGTTVESKYSIPMKARYIKVDNQVSGGIANSSMMITMSYE